MATIATIALGSNLGDREANLRHAIQCLTHQPGDRVLSVSPFIETEPVGMSPGTPRFLNAALQLETDRSPHALLTCLQAIEQQMGRLIGERMASRPIDLDLVFYGDLVIQDPDLIVPHPRYHERSFVLEPLLHLMPDATDPRTNQRLSRYTDASWSTLVSLDGLPHVATHLMALLPIPSIVAVRGEMGIGKTTLIGAMAACWGIRTSSPTFDIIRTYSHPNGRFLHADLYRLHSQEAVDMLDMSAVLEGVSLAFVEWPQQSFGCLSFDYDLQLSWVDETHRWIKLCVPPDGYVAS